MTREEALALQYGQEFYSSRYQNVDGSPMRFRVSGKVRTWKRDVSRIEIPAKHGLRDNYVFSGNEISEIFHTSQEAASAIITRFIRFELSERFATLAEVHHEAGREREAIANERAQERVIRGSDNDVLVLWDHTIEHDPEWGAAVERRIAKRLKGKKRVVGG